MRCLILLFIVGSAFAQPEWYGLWTTGRTISDLEICVRGDTADVLWIQDGLDAFDSTTARYIPYDLNQESLLHDPLEAVYIEDQWTHNDLMDMGAVSPDRWACLYHVNNRGENWSYGTFEFGTNILSGNVQSNVLVNVESCAYSDYPDHHEGRWSEGHSLSLGGDRLSVAYVSADVGPFDVWYSVALHVLDTSFNTLIETDNLGGMGSTGNEHSNRVIARNLPGDSLMLYTNWGSERTLYWGPFSEIDSWVHTYSPDCEYRNLRELYLTSSNRIVAVYDDNSLYQLIPYNPDTADCIPFAQLDDSWTPSWAFHPNYGFAALQVNPGFLFLARIDTTGAEEQPVGILYETDGEHFIVDADVTITDSGQVVAVWSEYTDWSEGPRSLKIGWTNWNTFLDTPEQGAPSVPRELSLSAFPNPFNSTVTISFDLPRSVPVSLAIFDIQGRLLETLRDETTQAGQHTIAWSPNELSSGVYFARLDAGDASSTAKLLYLK